MLYNGVFGCHVNTCYVILIGAFFVYIVYVQAMCLPMLRSYVMGAGLLLKPSRSLHNFRFKVMAQIICSCFLVTLTLTFDLCSILYHTHWAWCTGMSMRSFIRIRPVLMGDTAADTHKQTNTHTPNAILIVSQIPNKISQRTLRSCPIEKIRKLVTYEALNAVNGQEQENGSHTPYCNVSFVLQHAQ